MPKTKRNTCQICGLGIEDHGEGWRAAKLVVPGIREVPEHAFVPVEGASRKPEPSSEATGETQNNLSPRSSHTPGPWRVGGRTVLAIQYDHKPGPVCICKGEDAEANARLIAAAPDLLEAVRLAAQQLETLTPVHLNWHLATGEIARALRKIEEKATSVVKP